MPGSIYHIDYPVNVEGVFYYPTKGWGCDLWPWLDDNVVEEGCSHSSPFFCHFPGSGWWKWAWKEVRNMAFYWFYGPLLALWAAEYGCRLQRHTLTLLLYTIQPPPPFFFFGWVLLFKRIQLFLTDRWTSQVLTFPSWRSNWTWRDDKTRLSLYVPRFSGTFSSSFSQPNTWPNSHPSLATNVHGGYVHQNPTVSTDAAFCTPPAGNQYQCCFVLPAAAGSRLLCSVYSRHTHILSCWSKEFSLKQTEEAEAAAAAVLQFRLCVSAAVRASSYTEKKIN